MEDQESKEVKLSENQEIVSEDTDVTTSIGLKKSTAARLFAMKTIGVTYDDIILKLLAEYDKGVKQ
jgi:hypothetical protein